MLHGLLQKYKVLSVSKYKVHIVSDTRHLDEGMGYVSDIFSWTLTYEAYLVIQLTQIMHEMPYKV